MGFLQILAMLAIFATFWSFCWERLNEDLSDKELNYWTCRGCESAGFYVAETEGRVVGTVGWVRENDSTIEVCRVSVDATMRRQTVARRMVARVERVAASLGANKLKAVTSTAQED